MTYVDRQCPGGCAELIPGHWFACAEDWGRMPVRLQLAIVKTCPHTPDVHAVAVQAALLWFRANPRDAALIGQAAAPRRL
jgi:hypothetical protein